MNRFIIYSLLAIILININVGHTETTPSSWGYQLQNYNLEELKSSNYDILVLDYSKDGSDDEKFTTTEINNIRSGKEGRKIISYISIGEAEDYRYYWNSDWIDTDPEWLGPVNPDWDGNYKVKYWITEWQEIIKGYLQKIIDIGFDGIYLDIIDAYEFYEDQITNSKELMIEFVEIMANFTRNQVSDFMIIPQNGEGIVTDQYLDLVDGIAREEVYVIATNEKRELSETREIESYLDQFITAGKIVFTVDYANRQDLSDYASESASKKGYISLVTNVDLDRLGLQINTEDEGPINLFVITFVSMIIIIRVKSIKND